MGHGTRPPPPTLVPCSLSLVPLLSQLGQDIGLPEDEELLVLGAEDAAGHLLAGVLGVEDTVAHTDVHGDALAVVVEAAGSDGEHLAHLGLLTGGVRDHEAGGADLLLPDLLDEDTVAQGDQPGGPGGWLGGLGGWPGGWLGGWLGGP